MGKRYHLVGIGGIGMSGIAQILLRNGLEVSGSDLRPSSATEELKNLGAHIFIGHSPENIKGAEIVIYSSAIKEDNPEIQQANRLGLAIIKRAQALAELMQDKTVITVTGSHGKTTTTSLVSCLLLEAGLCPSVAIGGILRNIDNNACLGNGKYFVAEADESDGTFLFYRPKYSIITNIDYEHLDYYRDFNKELDAFKSFISLTQEAGCLFCCGDDINLTRILNGYKNKYILFGLNQSSQIYPIDIKFKGLTSEFGCVYNNRSIGNFHLALAGRHNISNSLSVIALGLEMGIDLSIIKKTLACYKGARRRLEVKFQDKFTVIDDYAHHPTEIKATLEAVRNLGASRVIAVFQPHRYTRTKLLLDEFGKSFNSADYVIITDIYPAAEAPIEGVNGKNIYDKIRQNTADKNALFLPKEEIVDNLLKIAKTGDAVVMLGAGDISKVCDELVARLKG